MQVEGAAPPAVAAAGATPGAAADGHGAPASVEHALKVNGTASSGEEMEVEGENADPAAVFSALDSLAPGAAGKAEEAFSAEPVQQQDYARRALHPMKVTFYELMIRQMMDDEFLDEAISLKNRSGLREAMQVEPNCLFKIYEEGYGKSFGSLTEKWKEMVLTPNPPIDPAERHLDIDEPRFDLEGSDKITYTDSYKNVMADDDPESIAKGEGKGGKDRDEKKDEGAGGKARPLHRKKANIFNKVHYNTQHKQMVRAVAFSPDGRFAASGSHDTTVKVLDVNKMYHYGNQNQGERRDQGSDVRPVLRTLYDHQGPVNAVQFHPHLAYLFTASADKSVKVFDLTRPSTQLKALSSIPDSAMVHSLAVHPSGDYLYVGTNHPTIRLYDLTRLECFTGSNQKDFHTGTITDLNVTSDGRIMASASTDGEIKLWDVVNNRVVNTFTKAHQGTTVCSVKWSRNLRYFLTAGCDGKAKLWDIRKGSEEPVFNMNVCSARNLEYARAAFVGQERFVAVASGGNDLCILDAQTGEYLQGAVARGGYHHSYNQHSTPVYCLASHPNDTKFLTGSDDHKVRYCEILNRPEEWVSYREMRRNKGGGGGGGIPVGWAADGGIDGAVGGWPSTTGKGDAPTIPEGIQWPEPGGTASNAGDKSKSVSGSPQNEPAPVLPPVVDY